MAIQTPGLCPNVEGCGSAKRGRPIWIPLGENFKCPTCRTQLTAPDVRAAPRRAFAVAVVVGAFVVVGGGAVFGAAVMPHHATPDTAAAAMIQRE